jgi:hypothetical protein
MRKKQGRPQIYDWPTLMDGDTWVAEQGVDFLGEPSSFRTYLYMKARQAGLRAKSDIDGQYVHFQFRQREE